MTRCVSAPLKALLIASTCLVATSCAAWNRLVAYGDLTGGYASDVTYATVHGRTKTLTVELPEICLVALGRGSSLLRSLTNPEAPERAVSPILDALTTADATLLCDFELDRLEAEGKLVVAELDGEAG